MLPRTTGTRAQVMPTAAPTPIHLLKPRIVVGTTGVRRVRAKKARRSGPSVRKRAPKPPEPPGATDGQSVDVHHTTEAGVMPDDDVDATKPAPLDALMQTTERRRFFRRARRGCSLR